MKMRARLMVSFAVLFIAAGAYAAQPATSCLSCHGGDMFDEHARAKVRSFGLDVHSQVGLSCHDCHGGNPDPKLADDMGAAMDPNFKENPYRGAPDRVRIPEFCGRCHSSADFMKRFNPAARVDQVTEYWTSMHGQRLKAGDTNVATCVDCHSVHDIRRRSQPESPVYATKVAETCSKCHSNPKLMASYNIPTDQYARWRVSVHANAMFEKGDVTAPTCNDCHGNHGARPPGVDSVIFVCGNCHAREAELFRKSRKHEFWVQHNEMMAGAKCRDCHEGKRAQLELTSFQECVTCHENHGVVRPSLAMLGALPDTPCAFCHEGIGKLSKRIAEPPEKAAHYAQVRADLLKTAEGLGLKGNQRYDWLVDRAQELPMHLIQRQEHEPAKLRPEFARLFDKFRIGKTSYTYRDIARGRDVTVSVRRCSDCHETEPPDRLAYIQATRGLTSMIARSERILLAAQRGGVEVRQARAALDEAVDKQIELETMVHTFAPAPILAKQAEGLERAEAALIAGQQSLDELSFRRKGLLVALAFIVLVLVGLALKIRML